MKNEKTKHEFLGCTNQRDGWHGQIEQEGSNYKG